MACAGGMRCGLGVGPPAVPRVMNFVRDIGLSPEPNAMPTGNHFTVLSLRRFDVERQLFGAGFQAVEGMGRAC